MFDRTFDNYRKDLLKHKHRNHIQRQEQKELQECNKTISDYDGNGDISFYYICKIKHLIYLNKFEEALIIINNIFGKYLHFDKNFRNVPYIPFSFSKEYIYELYFYSGFIKVCLKNYNDALQDYDKANILTYIFKEFRFRDNICYEIENINKKLYGIVEGSKKTKNI